MSEAAAPTVGSVWEIKSKANVKVTKPDGNERTFASFDGVAIVTLDQPGEFSADVDGKTHKVTAV